MQCVEQKTSSDGVRIFRALSRERVLEELHSWAAQQRRAHPEILRVGLFGSYAKGSFAPGSDIDLLLLVKESAERRWFMRSAVFDTTRLSVGADLFVYTEAEAKRMQETSSWFRHILKEIVWIV
jgi:uncharacterized protein